MNFQKNLVLFSLLIFCLLSVSISVAHQSKTIDKNNEFGGHTIEHIYSKDDKQYKDDGVLKVISYFNGNGELCKMDHFHTEDLIRKTGIYKIVGHMDKNGKPDKMESYATEKSAKFYGVYKSVVLFNSKGEKSKAIYYDKKGNILKEEILKNLK